MDWGKLLFWSSVLSLPLLLLPRKKPGIVTPGPTIDSGDGDTVVTEPSEPPVPFPPASAEVDNIPAEFRNPPPPPAGYSRMKDSEVPAAIMPRLPPLLSGALGTVTKLPTNGRDIAAVIEPHFHPTGGPVKPWGWHKGVSLYERKGAQA